MRDTISDQHTPAREPGALDVRAAAYPHREVLFAMLVMHDPELFDASCAERKLTHRAVARAAGLSPSFLSMVRSGTRRIHEDDAKAICRQLGVRSTSRLFETAPPTRRDRRRNREAQLWNDLHAGAGFVAGASGTAGSTKRSSSARSRRAASTREPASASQIG